MTAAASRPARKTRWAGITAGPTAWTIPPPRYVILRRKGIQVSAVFMGENSSIPAAERIYGKNLARIRGMDQLARAAGQLIQHEIRALGD